MLRVDNGIFKITSKSDDALLDAVRTSVGKRTRVNLKKQTFPINPTHRGMVQGALEAIGEAGGMFW